MKRKTDFSDLTAMFDQEASAKRPASLEPSRIEARSPLDPIRSDDVQPFDYDELPVEQRAIVRAHETALLCKLSSAIIEAGKDLLAIRAIIKKHNPGTWTQYLQTALPFSESAARNYMKAAELAMSSAPSATVAEIELMHPTAMYAAARAPAEVRRDVEGLLKGGKKITAAQIDGLVRSHNDDASFVMKHGGKSGGKHKPKTQQNNQFENEKQTWGEETMEMERKSVFAAQELIARLREHFDDYNILYLNELWYDATYDRLKRLLNTDMI